MGVTQTGAHGGLRHIQGSQMGGCWGHNGGEGAIQAVAPYIAVLHCEPHAGGTSLQESALTQRAR